MQIKSILQKTLNCSLPGIERERRALPRGRAHQRLGLAAGDAALGEAGQLLVAQTEQLAQHLVGMLAELGRAAARRDAATVDARAEVALDRNISDVYELERVEELARIELLVGEHLVAGKHRRGRHARLLQQCRRLELRTVRGPLGEALVEGVVMLVAVGGCGEARVLEPLRVADGVAAGLPLGLIADGDGDPCVDALALVVAAHLALAARVVGAVEAAVLLVLGDVRGEHRDRRLLHRELNVLTFAGPGEVDQRRDHAARALVAAVVVDPGLPGLHRPQPAVAGQRRDARGGLHAHAVGGAVRVRAGLPVAGERAHDDRGVVLAQRLVAEAQPLHHSRREVLDHQVRLAHQAQE